MAPKRERGSLRFRFQPSSRRLNKGGRARRGGWARLQRCVLPDVGGPQELEL